LVTGEVSEPITKKLRTMNMAMEGDGGEREEGAEQGENADMYQHIKEAKERFDAQALDAATKVSCLCCICRGHSNQLKVTLLKSLASMSVPMN
jgi:hypothetical protein